MSVKTYQLSTQKKLIDLNGNTVNFDLTFKVVSRDQTPFQGVVVDQHNLDNNDDIKYQDSDIKGILGGGLTSDNNVFQNYYLVLRSETPCQVEITIDKKEIPAKTQPITIQPAQLSKNKSSINWKLLLLLVAVVGIGVYLYIKYGKTTPTTVISLQESIPVVENMPLSSPVVTPVVLPNPTIQPTNSNNYDSLNHNWIDRLNSIPINPRR